MQLDGTRYFSNKELKSISVVNSESIEEELLDVFKEEFNGEKAEVEGELQLSGISPNIPFSQCLAR